ncbi:hypothetical protein [Candidatus Thiodubiliella endoseptemdiera]|uniref:hypothetical protein n=1 Tax=Candidatus Thiodubiliella endoseptemdiera TaxID=2738886 RepID=UPI0034DED6F3
MFIARIAYIQEKQLDKLKGVLNELNFDFVEKLESEMNPEVWVEHSDLLVKRLLKAGYLSKKDKLELSKENKASSITEILFFS